MKKILLKISKKSTLFKNILPPKLKTPYILKYLLYFLKLLYKTINYNNHYNIIQNFPNIFKSPNITTIHQNISKNQNIINKKLKKIFKINIIKLTYI